MTSILLLLSVFLQPVLLHTTLMLQRVHRLLVLVIIQLNILEEGREE